MTMTAQNKPEALQPHPLHAPEARRTYMWAEVVTAFGVTFGLVAMLRALLELSLVSVLVWAAVLLITIRASRRLRDRAWESTPGAYGTRRWRARRNPARLAHEGVGSLVVGVTGAVVLASTSASPWAVSVVAGFATYFAVAVACVSTRDVNRTAVRLVGPVALLFTVIVIAALPQTAANLYSVAIGALVGAPLGVVAGVMVRHR